MNPLDQLVSKLELAFSGRLVSVILYGSAASGQNDRFSDLNVLCVLKDITPKELASGEPILRWWRELGNPAPLLMSEEEVYNSADSFPIEFRDMQHRRRVLFGPDPIADLKVHDTHYRTQVEHELRSNLLRLRQQGAGVLSDSIALLGLCADSVTTFCVLGRHALMLAGVVPSEDRRALVRQLAQSLTADMTAFESLLDVRESKTTAAGVDPMELFTQYLVSIQRLVVFVDGLKHG
ncbi:MAG: nucleotidyltransferase domain-containing protein [Acidobacteriota bacterium]